jgi:uncharacterized protein (TIGR02145 family)
MMLAAEDNGVKVSNLAVSAGTPSTVTFDVQWTNDHAPEFVWSDTVWVWVDYNNNGVMERLPVIGATLTATSAPDVGKVVEDAGNNQGRWLVGNARSEGSFSATVQLFTDEPSVGGLCVYASNYPPMGEYLSSTEISFTGTPPYEVVLGGNDESTYTATVGKGESLLIPNGEAILSFTDKTGAPGTFTCIPSTVYDLVASASGFCEGSAGVIFALSGTDNGASYELYREGTPEAVATLVGTNSAATFSGLFGAGTYTAHTVPGGGFCPADMNGVHEVKAGVIAAPVITTQPASDSVCSNGTVQLRVVATGATAYQWRKDGNNVTDGSGGTSATYTTAALSASATYTVVVSNTECSVTSSAALITRITTVTDFTAFTPSSSEPIGMTWCLVDKRESSNNQTYKVRKMQDSRIWMVQDLKFGTCPNDLTHWNNDNSEAATASTPTVHDGYVGHCRSTTYTAAGFLYNWPAAMQNKGTYFGGSYQGCSGTGATANTCRGICPEGWHIPTGNSGGEFYDLHYNYNRGCVTTNGDCWNAFSDWEGVLDGSCDSDGTPNHQGLYGHYWSSTYNRYWNTYDLYFYNGKTYPGTTAQPNHYGLSVRCLRNY